MTSIEGAERLPDGDYSVPHRAAPPIPTHTAHSSTSSALSALPPWQQQQHQHHGRHASTDTTTSTTAGNNSYRVSLSSAGSAGSQRRKREGSFGILRRGKNSSRDIEISSPIQESAPSSDSPIASPSHSPRPSNDHEETATMFRSRSRNKKEPEPVRLPPPPPVPVSSPPLQQGQHQQQSQQEQRPQTQQSHQPQPHRFPPNHPLAGIQPPPPPPNIFQQDIRPDSVALFSQNSYVHAPPTQSFRAPLSNHPHSPPPQAPPPAPPAANFSRPGMPVSAYQNNSNKTSPNMSQQQSSSPAYAIRQGNAFAAQASSSPSFPGGSGTKDYVDNTHFEPPSMANRGRFNSVSTVATTINVNSPRRIRRRKEPTAFNVLVIGAKNCGKSSFISFLKHSLATPVNRSSHFSDSNTHTQTSSNSAFTPHYVETDLDGERVAITLWDSPGLEKSIVDLQMREMTTFVEAKFEETFAEEQKVSRTPGVRDTHIHCVFLLLDPSRLDLTVNSSRATQNGPGNFAEDVALENAMDLQVIQALWGKTAVIPVIAKADTVTSDHMAFLKRAVWSNLKSAKLDPLEVLDVGDDEEEEDEDEGESATGTFLDETDEDDDDGSESGGHPRSKSKPKGHNRASSIMASIPSSADETTPYIPMSILSPDPSELSNQTSKKEKIGRRFPWGFADPNDSQHCDFPRLRDTFFHEWRVELRDLSRSKWYEHWRTSRLKNAPLSKQRQRILSAGSSNAPIPSDTRSHTSSNRSPAMSPTMSPTMAPSMTPQNFYANGSTPNIHTANIAVNPMAMSAVPRTVMNGAGPTSNDVRQGGGNAFGGNMSKAERMMGMSPDEARNIRTAHGQPLGGTYRGVETYQQ